MLLLELLTIYRKFTLRLAVCTIVVETNCDKTKQVNLFRNAANVHQGCHKFRLKQVARFEHFFWVGPNKR